MEAWTFQQSIHSALARSRQLLEAAATEMNLRRIWLQVQSSNDVAVALYRRHGFAIEKAVDDGGLVVDGSPVPTLQMALTLRAN